MTARPVRDDQHGTITGYGYGCRCDQCRDARRGYQRASGDHVSADVLDAVYAAIERDADMDGLATSSSHRLAELAGISQPTAAAATRVLDAQGRIKVIGQVGRGGVPMIQLSDGVA